MTELDDVLAELDELTDAQQSKLSEIDSRIASFTARIAELTAERAAIALKQEKRALVKTALESSRKKVAPDMPIDPVVVAEPSVPDGG